MTERQQPAEAEQQIEGAREKREAQRLHDEHRIDAGERRHGERDRHHDGGDQHRVARCGPARGALRNGGHYRSFPNSPAGRTSSTTTMITKITVLDASG